MLKIYNRSYTYNNTAILADMMLTYSLVKFIDMPLFTKYAVTCIKKHLTKVSDQERSSSSDIQMCPT